MLLALWIIGAGIALLLVMLLAWVVQRRAGNAGWVDVFWTLGTGLAAVALALGPPAASSGGIDLRAALVAGLAALWSLRLGLHVALRVAHSSEDIRYTELREAWGRDFHRRLLPFLLVQAPCGLVLGLSVLLAARNPAPLGAVPSLCGLAVLVAAILGEALADRQLQRFRTNPANRGRICTEGLWGWSRHPNYFFEWLGWMAYPLLAIDPAGRYPQGWLAFAGPALMYVILVHLTGIPPVERSMARSRGTAFRDYRAQVSAFFPWPPRRALPGSGSGPGARA